MSLRRNWDSSNPSLASECAPPPRTGGGPTRLRVRGWGSPSSDDWRKSLALCCEADTWFPSPAPWMGGGGMDCWLEKEGSRCLRVYCTVYCRGRKGPRRGGTGEGGSGVEEDIGWPFFGVFYFYFTFYNLRQCTVCLWRVKTVFTVTQYNLKYDVTHFF